MRRVAWMCVVGAVAVSACSSGGGSETTAGEAGQTATISSADGWVRVSGDVFEGALLVGVVEGGPGFVAVGQVFPTGAVGVWLSEDAVEWSRVTGMSEVFADSSPQSIVSTDLGLVIVGFSGADGLVLLSNDGEVWSQAPVSDELSGLGLMSVTGGGPGLVAVGRDEARENAVVVTSPDGVAWTRVPHDQAVFGGAFLRGVTGSGPGLVAVGMKAPQPMDGAVVLTSPDGLTWTRLPDAQAFEDSLVVSVASADGGVVAVGRDFAGEIGVVLTSVAGAVWTRASFDPDVFGNSVIDAVTWTPDGTVAVGSTASLNEAVVWTSSDQLAWTRLPPQPGIFDNGDMNAIVATSEGFLIVGEDADGEYGVVWKRLNP